MFVDTASARLAAEVCGFRSVAMLDYLERSGVFIPDKRGGKRRGRGRRYSFREMLVLKVISELLRNGASVSMLKEALNQFQKDKWKADRGNLGFDDGPLTYLIVSGRRIYFAKNSDTIFDLMSGGQRVFNFILNVDQLHSDLCNDLVQGRLSI